MAERGRIIPARAGFTSSPRCPHHISRDHPRSRGVYPGLQVGDCRECGSSPLARGLRGQARPPPAELRIIPARAGFTSWHGPSGGVCGDHPRSRGVYPSCDGHEGSPSGSSPLARGLRSTIDRMTTRQGIIPARAGFTSYMFGVPSPVPDHPRSRGVYLGLARGHVVRFGSSPLARGLPGHDLPLREIRGIIPARAGFTGARCMR